jgi:cation transport protein ChaC
MSAVSGAALQQRRQRVMSLTKELVGMCHREIPRAAPNPDEHRFDDDEFDQAASELLVKLGDAPIWVFAYGSLIWNPPVLPAEQRMCVAAGWHRSFCLEMRSWRGTPEEPGLMMALRTGGSCAGAAQLYHDDDQHWLMVTLLKREIGGPIGLSSLKFIDLQTAGGLVRALCFYAEPVEVRGKPDLPLNDVAEILSRACGHAGSGAEYLFETIQALETAGIHDSELWILQEMVARDIRRRFEKGI